jgi:predicted DNA-binding antitoxin AbrB/MazE fold protein
MKRDDLEDVVRAAGAITGVHTSGRSIRSMRQTIEAIYMKGVLKPTVELPLRENQRVRLTVEPSTRSARIARLPSYA